MNKLKINLSRKQFCNNFLRLFALCFFLLAVNSVMAGELIVDFGNSQSANIYNLTAFPGWNNVNYSQHTGYVDADHDGLAMTSGTENYDNWQSISGTAMGFNEGDTIIATWYNNTGSIVSLWRPLISFTDNDSPDAAEGQPQWYAMGKIGQLPPENTNYLYNGQTVQTIYIFTSQETTTGNAPSSAGSHSVINICNNDSDYHGLVLDKIEIQRAAGSKPLAPASLQASRSINLPYSKIDLTWQPSAATGDVDIHHYRIFRNNLWVGKSSTTSFSDANLEPDKTYTYSVLALNIFNSKSLLSGEASASTAVFPTESGLLAPSDISYLGAFVFPVDTTGSSWNYRRGGLAYYPAGDPNNIDGDTDFPGSLYATGHTYDKLAAEISIPMPVISKNFSDLPVARTLQNFQAIEPQNTNQSNYLTIGLTYLSHNNKIYSTFYYWYNVSFTKEVTHGAFDPDFSNIYGGWWVGDRNDHDHPHFDAYAKFLGVIPEQWVKKNTPGKYLASGGERGGSSPDGPGLVAIRAWDTSPDIIPAADAELEQTTLLQYKNDGQATMNGWIQNDYFNGLAWVTAGTKSALLFSGVKAFGEYYYGYRDGATTSELGYNIPVSHNLDGGSKGGQARSYRAMIIFYKPDDLARVAKSQAGLLSSGAQDYMETWEPQPYAALDIDKYLIQVNPNNPDGRSRLEAMTYDRARGLLYITEQGADGNLADAIHVFRIKINTPTLNTPKIRSIMIVK
jgi:hypothetical protein